MRKRLGFTLMEMVVVIAVTTVLMVLAAGLLQTLFRVQQGGRERFQHHASLDRLARQFREDVHAAEGLAAEGAGGPIEVGQVVQVPPRPSAPDAKKTPDPLPQDPKKPPRWRLGLPGGRTVQYLVQDETVVRSEREGDKPVSQETFLLPPGAEVEVRLRGDKRPPLAALRVSVNAEAGTSLPPPVLLVEGVLGLDHRFATPAPAAPKTPEGKRLP